jgi:hypothetical protein
MDSSKMESSTLSFFFLGYVWDAVGTKFVPHSRPRPAYGLACALRRVAGEFERSAKVIKEKGKVKVVWRGKE